MKTIIGKLIELADDLDGLGLRKDADALDQLVAKAAKGEDFADLMVLFDEPVVLEDNEEEGPGRDDVMHDSVNMEAPEIYTPLDEEEAPLPKTGPGRLQMLKRRHELMKLKKLMEKGKSEEAMEDAMEAAEPSDEVKLPVAKPEDLEAFEDENDEEDMAANEADDGIIDTLKEKLKGVPELAKQLLRLVKDNPELLELLAL